MLHNSLHSVATANVFVTGFAKRGLPHTSSSMNLEKHNLVFNKGKDVEFPPSTRLYLTILTKFQVNSIFQSQVMNCQSS